MVTNGPMAPLWREDVDSERHIVERHAGAERIALIAESYARLTGKRLVSADGDAADTLWNLDSVVLAHGTQADPVFFYANRAALDLFALTGEQLLDMPSRLSAEMPERGERESLLAQVRDRGFIEDYRGVRIASTGQRFRIEAATVWNLVDKGGVRMGQAATFDRWVAL